MGLLSQGSPLNWEETKKYADHVRKHGIIQFLNIYNKVKDRQKDVLKWGDEVRSSVKLIKCYFFSSYFAVHGKHLTCAIVYSYIFCNAIIFILNGYMEHGFSQTLLIM